MLKRNHRRLGSATLEMTLVGIPMIFVLVSVIEMARGMWIYHTLAYSIREGTRFTIVHGVDCGVSPNACTKTVADIAAVIRDAAVGLDPGQMKVRMESLTDDTGVDGNGLPSTTLTSALSNTAQFPSSGGDSLQAPITFTATYPFQSAIAMFWPGAGSGMNFM